MDEELNNLIRTLSERLARLEDHDAQAEQAALMAGQNSPKREAKFAALYSMTQELAAREGISVEQFVKHFEERVRFYHDYYLRIVEGMDANWAGRIDERDLGDMPEGESYPPLFPEDIL